jgi:hypothetical protein
MMISGGYDVFYLSVIKHKNLVAMSNKIWQEYLFPSGLESHKKSFSSEGVGLGMSLFCVDLM